MPRLPFLSALIAKPASPASGTASGAVTPDAWGNLMVAAQGGHGGAYQRLLREMSGWLQRYFARRLPGALVDDAVQETLLAVHRRRHTYDPHHPLGAWLTGIARHKWIDQLRTLGDQPSDDLPEALAIDDHERAVTSATVLAGLLAHLRPEQAQAITLVKLHGYSIAEASEQTGLSPSAVKMNIHRGLGRLTAFIEKTHHVA